MVLTIAWATLRMGEGAGLRRSDVDLVTGSLRVANYVVEVAGQLHEGPPKTAAGRRAMSLPNRLSTSLLTTSLLRLIRSTSSRPSAEVRYAPRSGEPATGVRPSRALGLHRYVLMI